MSTWYRVQSWGVKIEAVEVKKETAETVVWIDRSWAGNPRESRSYKAGMFFPSFEEAKKSLVDKWEREVKQARISLDNANGQLGNALGLKEPS